MRRKTVIDLQKMKASNEKIAMITAYDATMAKLVDAGGVDMVLVGDSVGMVVQGMDDTLSVTLDDMVYHGRCVARGLSQAHLTVDMPFMMGLALLSMHTHEHGSDELVGPVVDSGPYTDLNTRLLCKV